MENFKEIVRAELQFHPPPAESASSLSNREQKGMSVAQMGEKDLKPCFSRVTVRVKVDVKFHPRVHQTMTGQVLIHGLSSWKIPSPAGNKVYIIEVGISLDCSAAILPFRFMIGLAKKHNTAAHFITDPPPYYFHLSINQVFGV
ncbi:hypothetical protein TNCV_307981 [Trichonephila clavipes]|nr:hypothetical protein TNCV_307981 [Trichonephila clavipes]